MMNTFPKAVCSWILAASLVPALAWGYEPLPYTMDLEARYHKFITLKAKGQQTLKKTAENCYVMEQKASASIGSQHQRSRFCIKDGNLVSQDFYSRESIFGSGNEYQGTYDAPKGTWTVKTEDKTKRFTSELMAMDPLSMQLGMAKAISEGAKEFDVTAMNPYRIETVRYEMVDVQTLRFPFGVFDAIKLRQTTRLRANQQNYVWMIDHKQWIPVKWERYKDGKIEFQIKMANIHY